MASFICIYRKAKTCYMKCSRMNFVIAIPVVNLSITSTHPSQQQKQYKVCKFNLVLTLTCSHIVVEGTTETTNSYFWEVKTTLRDEIQKKC